MRECKAAQIFIEFNVTNVPNRYGQRNSIVETFTDSVFLSYDVGTISKNVRNHMVVNLPASMMNAFKYR